MRAWACVLGLALYQLGTSDLPLIKKEWLLIVFTDRIPVSYTHLDVYKRQAMLCKSLVSPAHQILLHKMNTSTMQLILKQLRENNKTLLFSCNTVVNSVNISRMYNDCQLNVDNHNNHNNNTSHQVEWSCNIIINFMF